MAEIKEVAADKTFRMLLKGLPLNKQRAYVQVPLKDCELYVPCSTNEESVMQSVRDMFINIAKMAKY